MARKITQEEFIRSANEVHGNKYDYSLVNYVNSKTKVKIVCPKHGEFLQTPKQHLKTNGCEKCSYDNRVAFATENFIARAKEIHGDKYDYSKVRYVNCTTKVCIICPVHGEFWQTPTGHINGKGGCKKCYDDRRKTLVLGWGINDSTHLVMHGKKKELVYKTWTSMIRRCYSPKYHKYKPTYIGCKVCDEWRYYSNFERWFNENYKQGFVLDKDILVQGNKTYSPTTCCFIPSYINGLLAMNASNRGRYKTGVYFNGRKYIAQCGINKVQCRVGSFNTEEEAHQAYKEAKYSEIKRVAQDALNKGEIDNRIYEALLNFKINEY